MNVGVTNKPIFFTDGSQEGSEAHQLLKKSGLEFEFHGQAGDIDKPLLMVRPFTEKYSGLVQIKSWIEKQKKKAGQGIFPCTVCDTDVGSSDKLTTTEGPIFTVNEKTGVHKQFEGWTSRISSCESCLAKYGKPIKITTWPRPMGDVAEFEKAKDVVLEGSLTRNGRY